jgi:hypothetical protein
MLQLQISVFRVTKDVEFGGGQGERPVSPAEQHSLPIPAGMRPTQSQQQHPPHCTTVDPSKPPLRHKPSHRKNVTPAQTTAAIDIATELLLTPHMQWRHHHRTSNSKKTKTQGKAKKVSRGIREIEKWKGEMLSPLCSQSHPEFWTATRSARLYFQ